MYENLLIKKSGAGTCSAIGKLFPYTTHVLSKGKVNSDPASKAGGWQGNKLLSKFNLLLCRLSYLFQYISHIFWWINQNSSIDVREGELFFLRTNRINSDMNI
jgi:hypothetical protein